MRVSPTGCYSGHYREARVATTANITISTALNNGDTLDGITLATGDTVLVKNQTAGAENGIYVVSASPARWVNYNTDAAIRGSKVLVQEGTVGAGFIWACGNTSAITVDSTSISYTRTVRETIKSDITLTVKTSGGDFTTIAAALDFLAPFEISSANTVTISVDDGQWSVATDINITHPNGDRITITGANTHTKTLNSIQANTMTGNYTSTQKVITNLSLDATKYLIVGMAVAGTNIGTNSKIASIDSASQITLDVNTTGAQTGATLTFTGVAGIHSIVLNLDTVTNISEGDYVLVKAASGGTKPTFIDGCHKVTAVDAVNGRIVVTTKHKHATDPSGAVASTSGVTVIKTIVTTTANGFVCLGTKLGTVDKMVLVRSGATGGWAFQSFFSGYINIGLSVGICNYTFGMFVAYTGSIQIAGVCVSGNTNGALLSGAGLLRNTSTSYWSGNTTAVNAENVGDMIVGSDTVFTGNTTGISCRGNATVASGSIVITGNTTALYAFEFGYIKYAGITTSDNGTDCSPTVNTQGNQYGMVSSA